MATTNDWLTVNEVAEELGVTSGRVRQFIVDGRLNVWRVNPRLNMISREELERFRQLLRLNGTPGHVQK